jgi:hypothetical protein
MLWPGGGAHVPSTHPPPTITPDREIVDTVKQPTWAAFAEQIEINEKRGHHRRLSSLNATANPFKSQAVLSPLAATHSPSRSSAPQSGHHHQSQHGPRGMGRPTPAPRGRGTHPTVYPSRYQPVPTPPYRPMGAFSTTTRRFRPPLPPTISATATPTTPAGRGMGNARGARGRGRGSYHTPTQRHTPPAPVAAQAYSQSQQRAQQ